MPTKKQLHSIWEFENQLGIDRHSENSVQGSYKPLNKPSVIRLLPCPLCGENPETGRTAEGQFTAKCYNCGILMVQDRKDKLESLWNTRQGNNG